MFLRFSNWPAVSLIFGVYTLCKKRLCFFYPNYQSAFGSALVLAGGRSNDSNSGVLKLRRVGVHWDGAIETRLEMFLEMFDCLEVCGPDFECGLTRGCSRPCSNMFILLFPEGLEDSSFDWVSSASVLIWVPFDWEAVGACFLRLLCRMLVWCCCIFSSSFIFSLTSSYSCSFSCCLYISSSTEDWFVAS